MERRIIAILSLLFATVVAANGQNQDNLGDQLSTVKQEIEQLNKQISSNVTQQQSQQKRIEQLNAKIRTREENIQEIDRRVLLLEQEMGSDGTRLSQYQAQLASLKSALSSLLRSAYKKCYSGSGFSPASISENQKIETWRRQIALLTSKIQIKISEIDSLGRTLGSRLDQIKQNYADVCLLQNQRASEISKLQNEKTESADLKKQLQREEGTLRTQAQTKQQRMEQLQKQISQAIARETANNTPQANKSETIKLSKIFGENRGKLPIPVAPAKIVDRHGVHQHPTQKELKINNNGINIRSATNATVKCVADGEVRTVLNVEGMGNSIIIRHGNYLTVYSNLKELKVKNGEKVNSGQILGTLREDELHFEIWEETKNLNPESWFRNF